MARTIEAKAVISGEDRLSKVLDGLNKKFKDIGKGARVSADVARLNKELEQAQKGLLAIDKLRSTQAGFGAARTRYRTAQEDVARLARELEAARKAAEQFDGIKAFSKNSAIAKEMTDARKRVTELEGSLRSAQREVKGASSEFERQTTAIKAAKQAADEAGVSLRRLGEEEARLKRKVDFANDGLARQAHLHGDGLRPIPVGAARTAKAGASAAAGFGAAEVAGAGLSGAAAMRFGLGAAGVAGGAVMVGDQFRRAYDSSVSFERRLIEVGKATDTSGTDLNAYGESLLKLSRQTGKTKEELAEMLASAGFAGRPKQELMDFTEYASKATVAWGTSASETGDALAQIGNIYEADQKRIEQIGDALNVMADNSASKETDLLEFMRRAGPSAKDLGIQPEQLLPFGAAMKEVGVRNETAGTAYEALLNVMKLGDKFSKSAAAGLSALGVNSDKMRKGFVAKPVETMMGLLEKIDKISDKNKKAEIMTDLFGKEFQDDIAKMLNALPKLHQYLDLLQDKGKIAAGGVRFQFAQNLDKDVSKIDRATRAIDVLYKRVGDPIKVQVGGVAEQITRMVDRLEQGDTVAQRLIKRLTGDGKGPEGPQTGEDGDLIGRGVTMVLKQLDPKFGATEGEQEWMDRQRAAADERIRAREIESRPGEIEARIRRQQALANEAKGTTGMRGSILREQAKGAEAEIARLRGDLAQAWEAISALRVQQRRDAGAFSLDGPTGKAGLGIGPGRFSLDAPGMPSLPSRTVPLPPQRPAGMGNVVPLPPQRPAEFARMDQQITAEVKSLPPLSGEVTGQGTLTGTISVEPSQWFMTKISGLENTVFQMQGKIASIGSGGPGSTGKSSPDAGKGGRD